MGGKIFILVILCFLIFSFKAEEKTSIITIKGVIETFEYSLGNEADACFTIRGDNRMFVIDIKACSDVRFVTVGNEVEIDFWKTGNRIIHCSKLRIVRIIVV